MPSDTRNRQATVGKRLRHKLHPARFPLMSGKMAALVGYVLEEAFVQPCIWEVFVTSDGFLLGRVGDEFGANSFLGSYADLVRNWHQLLRAADLTFEERLEAECRFAARVGIYGEVVA